MSIMNLKCICECVLLKVYIFFSLFLFFYKTNQIYKNKTIKHINNLKIFISNSFNNKNKIN
jgi:hypothetical protein